MPLFVAIFPALPLNFVEYRNGSLYTLPFIFDDIFKIYQI